MFNLRWCVTSHHQQKNDHTRGSESLLRHAEIGPVFRPVRTPGRMRSVRVGQASRTRHLCPRRLADKLVDSLRRIADHPATYPGFNARNWKPPVQAVAALRNTNRQFVFIMVRLCCRIRSFRLFFFVRLPSSGAFLVLLSFVAAIGAQSCSVGRSAIIVIKFLASPI